MSIAVFIPVVFCTVPYYGATIVIPTAVPTTWFAVRFAVYCKQIAIFKSTIADICYTIGDYNAC